MRASFEARAQTDHPAFAFCSRSRRGLVGWWGCAVGCTGVGWVALFPDHQRRSLMNEAKSLYVEVAYPQFARWNPEVDGGWEVTDSLGIIVMESMDDPYRRVIEAELAIEAF